MEMSDFLQPHIEIGQVARLMRRVETHHEAAGWHTDGHLWIYLVYDQHDQVTAGVLHEVMRSMGAPVRNRRYTAQPLLPPRMFNVAYHDTGLYPPAALRRWAHNAAYVDTAWIRATHDQQSGDNLDRYRQIVRMPGILGYLACYEAFTVIGYDAGKATIDPSTAQECRILVMVDALDRVHRIIRARGSGVDFDVDSTFQGDIPTSLRLLMDTSTSRLPQGRTAYETRYGMPDGTEGREWQGHQRFMNPWKRRESGANHSA